MLRVPPCCEVRDGVRDDSQLPRCESLPFVRHGRRPSMEPPHWRHDVLHLSLSPVHFSFVVSASPSSLLTATAPPPPSPSSPPPRTHTHTHIPRPPRVLAPPHQHPHRGQTSRWSQSQRTWNSTRPTMEANKRKTLRERPAAWSAYLSKSWYVLSPNLTHRFLLAPLPLICDLPRPYVNPLSPFPSLPIPSFAHSFSYS